MSAQTASRRHFLKLGSAAGVLSMLPRFAVANDLDNPHTAWFRKAKFGMFIHWGPYSLASVEASWPIMRPSGKWNISEAEYRSLWKRFNPTKYDPDHFIDLARSAGQQYMVFTTKHHDGFCMFDSDYTDYKITKTPYGKDIVGMLADACKRREMPLGFYYSPPDLTHPGFRDTSKLAKENWNGEPNRPEWSSYLNYMELQLTELLTRYGDCKIIWFDGLNHQQKYDGQRFLRLIHTLQPKTLVNDRIGVRGDFVTPEQFIPKAIPTKDVEVRGADPSIAFHQGVPQASEFQLWETCMTINKTWAYNANDRDFKSTQELIRALIEVASRGGNFLLNIGPQPDGLVQPEFQERLRGIGDWLEINGESIFDTIYGPIQNVAGIRTTSGRDHVYVHLFDPPNGSLVLPDFARKVASVRLLATSQLVRFSQTEQEVTIQIVDLPRTSSVNVLALRLI
ncbi:alpha-L-fucosidase [Edaphobacter albus]|uniref:alpha-L-fucosidase n=1 Tax=Edaphobacter sp. 4G125 TaxID=2763071 RepID=UPI00164488FA|nr:alpha-L-fucosidase [Edaphobacter sp. 4G125]QNI38189.1 alpha-L-fucosidase [Edaphobacter sp. 4G125]